MKYIIFNKNGIIKRILSCSGFDAQAQEGEYIMEGEANDVTQYISNDTICSYTSEELEAKSNISYGFKWQMPERIVVQEKTDDEIREYKSLKERSKRSQLLSEMDIVVSNPLRWASMTTEQQKSWVDYRQALLDVPQQEGFPENINWPTKPSL